MSQVFDIDPFGDKIEDVSIHFNKLTLNFFNEVIMDGKLRFTAFTNVAEDVAIHYYSPHGRDCVGGIIVEFRNQGKDFNMCLILTCVIMAHSPIEDSGKSLFCKAIQFIFDWTDKYIKENRISDREGNPFVLPAFNYAKDQFTSIPD